MILCFQKPYFGKPVDCITETGAGALNIEAGRIGLNGNNPHSDEKKGENLTFGDWLSVEMGADSPPGRWPSNFILMDEMAANRLDEMSGWSKSNSSSVNPKPSNANMQVYEGFKNMYSSGTHFADSGGASRYFYKVEEQIDEADPVFYCAKASRSERDAGLINSPLVQVQQAGLRGLSGGDMPVDDKRCERDRFKVVVRNIHPTIKPISLCKYLSSILLPPPEYAPRHLLVPFSGTGSEMIGGLMAGWDHITGVEQDNEYVTMAESRLKYWQSKIKISDDNHNVVGQLSLLEV